MEGKIIIGFLTAIILGITATFLNSEKLSKTQKIILFILILFPPAQWILGIILLNNHKINLKRKTRTIISKNNEDIIALDKKNYEILIKKKRINRDKGVKNLEEKNAITQNMYDKKVALLKKSFDMNLISKTEFDTKLKNIEHENNEAEKEIQNSEKFEISKNTLKKMYDNEILSKEEYDLKVQEQKEIIYKIKSDNVGFPFLGHLKVR